jgi:hypothetical protein
MVRVEYTLSFENYLEMTSSRREKKNFKAAAISAVLGFSCITAGYLLLKLRLEGQFFPGGLLLATGLLLTFLAMILGVLAKPRASRPDKNVLRREYDSFHADKRAIEFDEKGWRLFWYEGEDVRPWSCLRQVYDLDTLLVFGTETTYYWLPKAVLERNGQLDQLKALAESYLTNRQQLFQVPLRPSAVVSVMAQLFHRWRHQRTARLLCYAASLLIAYWIFILGPNDLPRESSWLLAFVPLLLISCEALFYLVKHLSEDWSAASPNAEIMADCIAYKTNTLRWIVEYRRVVEFLEIPGAFLLYFDVNSYYLIPKQGFTEERVAQFRETVRNNRYRHLR